MELSDLRVLCLSCNLDCAFQVGSPARLDVPMFRSVCLPFGAMSTKAFFHVCEGFSICQSVRRCLLPTPRALRGLVPKAGSTLHLLLARWKCCAGTRRESHYRGQIRSGPNLHESFNGFRLFWRGHNMRISGLLSCCSEA